MITIRTITAHDWPLIERLFGERGACGGCWCMWPRLPQGGKLWEQSKGETNRRNFRRLVRAGEVHAVIALAGDEPIGWCCFGPRPDFPRLDRIKAIPPSPAGAWSIVCFYIPARHRQQGLATQLAAAATQAALAAGAKSVEGYPAEPKTGVASASFAWMGLPGVFQANGYDELPRPQASRRLFVKSRWSPGFSRSKQSRRPDPPRRQSSDIAGR
jgi:hypothetical protein